MEFRHITANPTSTVWSISFDAAKKELFVPEFCVYLFIVKQGQIRLHGQNFDLQVTTNTCVCLPPLPLAVKLECSEKTSMMLHRIDAWYFVSQLFLLNSLKVLPIKQSLTGSVEKLMTTLQGISLPKASSSRVAQIKEGITTKNNLLSNKQVNRYLTLWFGLILSKLRRVFAFEAFVKNECGYGKSKPTLTNNVDYDSFYDYSHFGHTFKAVTGMSPETYLLNEGTVQSLFW